MSTLSEIEKAAEMLPAQELESLIEHLTVCLYRRREPEAKNDLSEHAGVMKLREDPLIWQRAVRDDWT